MPPASPPTPPSVTESPSCLPADPHTRNEGRTYPSVVVRVLFAGKLAYMARTVTCRVHDMSVCGEIAKGIIGSAQALALFAQPANRLTTTRVSYRNKAGNYPTPVRFVLGTGVCSLVCVYKSKYYVCVSEAGTIHQRIIHRRTFHHRKKM